MLNVAILSACNSCNCFLPHPCVDLDGMMLENCWYSVEKYNNMALTDDLLCTSIDSGLMMYVISVDMAICSLTLRFACLFPISF